MAMFSGFAYKHTTLVAPAFADKCVRCKKGPDGSSIPMSASYRMRLFGKKHTLYLDVPTCSRCKLSVHLSRFVPDMVVVAICIVVTLGVLLHNSILVSAMLGFGAALIGTVILEIFWVPPFGVDANKGGFVLQFRHEELARSCSRATADDIKSGGSNMTKFIKELKKKHNIKS